MKRLRRFMYNKDDEPVKNRQIHFSVIPVEAGIQSFRGVLDPGVRRGDDMKDFLRLHQRYWVEKKAVASVPPSRNSGPACGSRKGLG
jgi:hypothetical protein